MTRLNTILSNSLGALALLATVCLLFAGKFFTVVICLAITKWILRREKL